MTPREELEKIRAATRLASIDIGCIEMRLLDQLDNLRKLRVALAGLTGSATAEELDMAGEPAGNVVALRPGRTARHDGSD